MYKKLFKITVLFILVGCTSNTIYEKPKDLIPKAQMINLLTDLYIANAAGSYPDKKGNRNIKYFPLIYEKYKIDSNQFKRSNHYYTSKVKDFQFINQSVFNNLEKLKKEYGGYKAIQDSLDKIKRDSLQKIKLDKRKKLPRELKRPIINSSKKFKKQKTLP